MGRNRQGFTIIELMIVVAMIAVLAMIVLPNFSVASDEARESALAADLQAVTRQIELYRIEHGGHYPHIDENGNPDPDTDALVARLTSKTDETGALKDDGDCGPYLLEWPSNPFCPEDIAKDIMIDGDADSPRDDTTGWYYSTTTGQVSPNSSAGGL